jgi:hypothetical protein
MRKEKSKLAKRLFIGGLVVKGLILPIKADCPSIHNIKHYNGLQQNLKKIECTYKYEKRENIPTNHYNYDSIIKSL